MPISGYSMYIYIYWYKYICIYIYIYVCVCVLYNERYIYILWYYMALSIGFAEAITAAVCDLFAAATCAAQTWNPGRSPASRPRSGKTSCPVESWKDQVRWVRWVRWVRCIGCHIGWVTWDFRHFGSVWKLSHGQQIASRIFTDPLLQPGSVKGSLWTSSPICPESGCEERSEHQRNTWRGW